MRGHHIEVVNWTGLTVLCSFRLVLEGKADKEIPESPRLKFLEKILASNFTLPGAEDNTPEPLNRGGITDSFLLRTLLAIWQKLQESSFSRVIDFLCY